MTVTRDQAQMLTDLARACRPTGASRWDAAGVQPHDAHTGACHQRPSDTGMRTAANGGGL